MAENGGEEATAAYITDPVLFFRRLKSLQKAWQKNKTTIWGGADALVFLQGGVQDDRGYGKIGATVEHLFTMILTETLVVLVPGTAYILTNSKKIQRLQNLKDAGDQDMKVELLKRNKEDADREALGVVIEAIKKSVSNPANAKPKIGTPMKDEQIGGLVKNWKEAIGSEFQEVDISAPLGVVLAVKDEEAMNCVDQAANFITKVFKKKVVKRLMEIINDDLKATHEKLAEEVEEVIKDASKIDDKISSSDTDSCYFPILQSGGEYDIRASGTSNGETLKFDVIIAACGASYKEYGANIGRTFLVDPPKKVQGMYKTLAEMYDRCLEEMVPGNELKRVMEAAKEFLDKKAKGMSDYLPKNLGSAMGVEFRDNTLVLNAKNTTKFREGMVFNLIVGLSNIPFTDEDKKACKKNAALRNVNNLAFLVADTVRVGANKPDVLTKYDHHLTKVLWEIEGSGDEEEEEEEEEKGQDDDMEVEGANAFGSIAERIRSRTEVNRKGKDDGLDQSQIDQRVKELLKRKMKIKALKIKNPGGSLKEENETKEVKDLEVYRNTEEFPSQLRANQIFVDMEREAVLLPVYGVHIPFHISTIKHVVQPDADRAASYLRINFFHPGQALGKTVSENVAKLVEKYGQTYSFIKELTYRSLESRNISQAFRLIQELRKRVSTREKTEKEEADLVEQDKLEPLKNAKVPRLSDVEMRPQISGRKTSGALEAHVNGLRFKSKKNEVVDIMYKNIRNAIFQPCKKEHNVIIHFHLKDPIMINRKKTWDVQFFAVVVEAVINMEGNRRAMHDPDEHEEEQREIELKKRLNSTFKDFCLKVNKLSAPSIEFDAPYRELEFTGKPHKEMVVIQFTSKAICNVTDTPFFFVSIDDIEHVHFERIMAGAKNFDMVILLKNFSEKDPVIIEAIPRDKFLKLQETLLDIEVTFTYGPRNLKWRDTINEIVSQSRFYFDEEEDGTRKDAGWEFLLEDNPNVDEDEEDEEEEESEFEPDESEEEDDEDDDDSDFEEEEEEEEEEEGSYDEDDEDGEDWDELEEKAAADDRAKTYNDDDERGGKKRGKPSGRAPPPPPKRGRR